MTSILRRAFLCRHAYIPRLLPRQRYINNININNNQCIIQQLSISNYSTSPQQQQQPPPNKLRNNAIKSPFITVLDHTGTKLGIMPVSQALSSLDTTKYDLVQVSNSSAKLMANVEGHGKSLKELESIPICKWMVKEGTASTSTTSSNTSSGKSQQPTPKQKQQQSQQSQQQSTKELEIRTNISPHDLNIKLKKAIEFLQHPNQKYKVQFNVKRKHVHGPPGNNINNTAMYSADMVEILKEKLKDVGTLTSTPRMQGRALQALFVPKKRDK